MNRIQKAGVLVGLLFMIPGIVDKGREGMIFAQCTWASLYFGYVAGSLWRVRHALHFWWSLAVAGIAHCCLIPVYGRLIGALYSASHQQGRGIIYLTGALLAAEILASVLVLKRVALTQHNSSHASTNKT